MGRSDKVEGIRYTREGVPKVIASVVKEDKTSPRFLAVVLTILTLTRCLYLPADPDVNTITAPQKGNGYDISRHIWSFWRDLGYTRLNRVPKSILWRKFHYTTKSGPNGQALWTCLDDLRGVFDSPDLVEAIRIVGGETLYRRMTILWKYLPQ